MEKQLRSYLQENITVQNYFRVMEQILTTLDKVQQQGMQMPLLLDSMGIENGKLQTRLVMEDSIYELKRVVAFLKEVTFACVFAGGEDCGSVTSFLQSIDGLGNSNSVRDVMSCLPGRGFSQELGDLPGRGNSQEFITTQGRGGVSGVMNSLSGQLEDGETGVLDPAYWQKLEGQNQRMTSGDETGVLDPAYWNQALQRTPSTRLDAPARRVYGKLIHRKSGREIPVDKENFWIGKEDVDLQIDKEVISRKHAVLICKGNHFFLSDNGSTNKTYVENREIPAKASVEIFDGTRIKFANEEYEFRL